MWFAAILYIISALFILFAGVDYMIMSADLGSAPQAAAFAGMKLVGAVIPYCLARVVHETIRIFADDKKPAKEPSAQVAAAE